VGEVLFSNRTKIVQGFIEAVGEERFETIPPVQERSDCFKIFFDSF
jgi:hypothetical protein